METCEILEIFIFLLLYLQITLKEFNGEKLCVGGCHLHVVSMCLTEGKVPKA